MLVLSHIQIFMQKTYQMASAEMKGLKIPRQLLIFAALMVVISPIPSVDAFSLPSRSNSYTSADKAPGLQGLSSKSLQSPTPSLCYHQHSGSSSTRLDAIGGGASAVGTNAFWLVRILFLRGLAFVYGVAFLVALHQNKALLGDNGITPARRILNAAEQRGKDKRMARAKWIQQRKKYKIIGDPDQTNRTLHWVRNTRPYRHLEDTVETSKVFQDAKELLWDRSDAIDRPLLSLLFMAKDRHNLDPWLDGIAKAGISMSAFVLATGAANVPILLGMWLCQRALMSVGGPWYGFGWEPQLAELGFHALFLVPLLSLNPIPAATPVPTLVIWTIRWYLFRIMMGAGLIKMRSGDRKWKDLTAMDGFYETQPVPNPLSRYLHRSPKWFHKFEVLTNHFVELVAPFLFVIPGLPRSCRVAGGFIQIMFQTILISSGNLSFLNWLTAVPALWCFDDAVIMKLFYPFKGTAEASALYCTQIMGTAASSAVPLLRRITSIAFAALIAKLSVPVVNNLLSRKQLMNASFDRYRLVNSYGAFGTVSDQREELVIESADNVAGPWREYSFKVKPGPLTRRSPWISPYHYRLDWLMWIAAVCGGIERSPWLLKLLKKLLDQDQGVLDLLAEDPWVDAKKSDLKQDNATGNKTGGSKDSNDWDFREGAGTRPGPKYIQIIKYRYNFNYDKTLVDESGKMLYWRRERIGRYFPRQGVLTKELICDMI